MERGRNRRTTGRESEGTVHRVGLTRHCLTSGRIQLPFALGDAFPEGDLLAHDVDHDEVLLLESLPPRRLSGLREYFERNELQVNDLLELRLATGELRLACVRRARRAPDEERGPRAAAPAPDARPASEPPAAHDAPGPDRDRVIGRIGSVTVRRLGSGRFAPPPEAALRTTRRDGRAIAATDPGTASDAPAPGGPSAASDTTESPAPRADADAGRAETDGRPPGTPATVEGRGEAPGDDAGEDLDALLDTAPAARAEAPRDRVGAGDLLDAAEARARDRTGREAPVLRWLRRPRGGGGRQQPRRPEPRRAPRAAEAEAPRAPDAGASRAEAVASAAHRPSEAAAAPVPVGGGAAVPAGDPGTRQRAREEALSRAGDLRSRMVRWLLDPRTPVIIQHEHVQERFGLEPGVARDVLDGILDDPPPSLRLTVVRDDMLRISRVTVQQEG